MFFDQFLGNITLLGGESILQQANIHQYYSGAPTSNLTDALSVTLLDTMHSFVEQIQQGQKQNGWKGPVALGETSSFWVSAQTRTCRRQQRQQHRERNAADKKSCSLFTF